MKTNVPVRPELRTHEGAPARRITPEQQLRRLVSSCMLWENGFYASGVDIADAIKESVAQNDPATVAALAVEARTRFKLRHVPLLLVRELARTQAGRAHVAATLDAVIQRPDELAEFLALYWQDGRQPLASSVKKGLARAFPKFSAYQLAKYNRDGQVKLRDVLFLTHPKPKDDAQAQTWKALAEGTLAAPDTWEVALSGGADKKETFTRLMRENKLGALALLRNLRGMTEAGVDMDDIRAALGRVNTERVLPFRFITAARHAPRLESELEALMLRGLEGQPKLPGTTVLLLDRSGSMSERLSGKSELTRYDAACALAMLAREVCERVELRVFYSTGFTYHSLTPQVDVIPPRRGFALRDTLGHPDGGTQLGHAVQTINSTLSYDRLIVFTDEQSADAVPNPIGRGYMVNVASNRNGVGYGPWLHVDGFSESVIDWILEVEHDAALLA